MTDIVYSDGTPDVAFQYDRMGRMVSAITLGVSTNLYGYNLLGQLTNETVSLCGSQLRKTISRSYDALGREAGFSLGSDYKVVYGYDEYGRFHSVSSSVASSASMNTYAYLAGSDLLAGMTNSSGFSWTRAFETNRNLIASIENRFGANLISRFDYDNDSLARRTRRVDNLTVTNDFDYNVRSEVIEALMGTNSYGYAYDPIGNRLTAANNGEALTYHANLLNQYTSISNGAIIEPQYDEDGNMNASGDGWTYVWNADNRMILASNGTTVVTCAYDHQGRRVAKTVNGAVRQYLWDGWNMVAEARASETNWYVWGLDLSQSLQGAGGVGGLLAVTQVTNSETNTYFPAFDGNGNVCQYVDASNGSVVAYREYSPFGQTISLTGDKMDELTHWFSTKPLDVAINRYDYGLRGYWPNLGRFGSRDPLDEMGGPNLFAAMLNDPISKWDFLGLKIQCNCLDDYLQSKQIMPSLYTVSGDQTVYAAKQGVQAKFSDLEAQILWGMLKDSRSFEIKDFKLEELKAHVNARMKVVENAKSAAFSYNEERKENSKRNDKYWKTEINIQNKVTAAQAVQDLWDHPSEYALGCNGGATMVMLKGILDAIGAKRFNEIQTEGGYLDWRRLTIRSEVNDPKNDWVPGDRSWASGWNLIYLGDLKWWQLNNARGGPHTPGPLPPNPTPNRIYPAEGLLKK